MTEQLFEELAKRHPDLFQKSGTDYFSCGEGWFDILDILCEKLNHDAYQSRASIQHYLNLGDHDRAAESELDLADALDKLPVIRQVKEKFGSLRFYADGLSDEHENYVRFAEAMSGRTCEECGDRGKSRNDGWIAVLCDAHAGREKDLADE